MCTYMVNTNTNVKLVKLAAVLTEVNVLVASYFTIKAVL